MDKRKSRRRPFYTSPIFAASSASLTVLVILIAIATSPIWISSLPIKGFDWLFLSYVGQSYGAASAIISALALVGVSVSILLQIHENRRSRLQTVRLHQFELNRQVAEDPENLWSVIAGPTEWPASKIRRQAFRTSFLHYLYIGYSSGLFDEATFGVELLPDYFSSSENRERWDATREWWLAAESDRAASRRFAALMDSGLAAARARGPAGDEPKDTPETPGSRATTHRRLPLAKAGILAVGALGAIILCALSTKRQRRMR